MHAPSRAGLVTATALLLSLQACGRFDRDQRGRGTTRSALAADEQERWVERAGGPKGAKRCFDAIEALETSKKEERISEYAEACSAFYSEKTCADAVRAIPGTPEDRRATVPISACRDAYCPKLPEPQPRFCATTGAKDLDDEELLAGWDELHPAILALDATRSPEASELFTGLARRMASRHPMPTMPTSTRSQVGGASVRHVTIMLSGGSGGSLLALLDMKEPFLVPEHARAKDFDALVSAATSKTESAPNVSIVAAEGVPHKFVVQLLDALAARGATNVRFGHASRSPAPSPTR